MIAQYYDIGVVLELDTANQKAESMFRSVLTAAEPSTMISTSQMRPTSNSFRYRINASGTSSEPFLNSSFSGHAALLIDYAAFILPLLILMVFTPKWLKRQFRRQALPGYHRFEWQCVRISSPSEPWRFRVYSRLTRLTGLWRRFVWRLQSGNNK
jgi:hypothetical protein